MPAFFFHELPCANLMDPNLSPTDMPATPHCHVLRLRLGLFWGGFLLASGVGFTALLVGGILWGSLGPVWGGGIAGGGLLLLATGIALVRRATAPMLAVLTDDTLHLEPRGRSVGYGHAATAYPLADLTSYNLMASPNGAQVTLETSGGAKLQLWPRFAWARRTAAEKAADAALPDVVDLDTLGPELLRRMELR